MTARSAIVVFCPRPAPGTWASAVLRELATHVEVRACGPGWQARDLAGVDPAHVRLLFELDAAPGCVARPTRAPGFDVPRAAWLVETSRKPDLHRDIARECDLVFHAHQSWAAALGKPSTWLPLCADQETFRPQEVEREWDVAFVGPDPWRADPLVALARHRGLRVCVTSPGGPEAKAQAAHVYARSKAIFHRHFTNALDVRVLEGLLAGRVVLVDRRDNGLETLAGPGQSVITYADEGELEDALLGLLGDDARRVELERQAATLGSARIGAKARVADLVAALEARFGPLRAEAARAEPARPVPTTVSFPAHPATRPLPSPAPPRASTGVRWLVLADGEPPAVWLASYAERLGAALHARGDDVTVLRLKRGRLPLLPTRPGQPSMVEVELSPLPAATTPENAMLLASARLQRIANHLAREHGPFHGLLVEAPLGAIVGPPIAERLGLPLVLSLEDCEVSRRGNNLTRDQLYRSELEHWTADRARLVVVPTAAVEADVRRHYKANAVAMSGWPVALGPSSDRGSIARLRERLGLPAGAVLVRAPQLGTEDAVGIASELARRGRPVVVVGCAVVVLADQGGTRFLGSRPVAGPALAALAAGCASAVHVGREDLGAGDVAMAASSFATAPDASPEAVLAGVEGAVPGRRLAPWDHAALDALSHLVASGARQPARVPALVGEAP